ncbi:hypothetical protein FGG08_006458 [Glutinoglossum americanum]|uniref:Uncharacterized protein n=1 Tax=Glutinoglossum americanum TaxID=1670608 RepID=A0A9P8I3F3_9PEZI|nr:hypothetical protein FGG08_006458 [Glutinoglossum americanum]
MLCDPCHKRDRIAKAEARELDAHAEYLTTGTEGDRRAWKHAQRALERLEARQESGGRGAGGAASRVEMGDSERWK